MKIKLARASVFCFVALLGSYVADADSFVRTEIASAEDQAALGLYPDTSLSTKYHFAESNASSLVLADINCETNVDLCGKGTACEGIKITFLNLCDSTSVFMTHECSFLLSKLHGEAQNQNIDVNCVNYLRRTVLDRSEEMRHDEVSKDACPTEEGWATNLRSGQTETVSCAQLYSSGIFYGRLHRYCMLGGQNLIHDDCNLYHNATFPMVGLGMNDLKLSSSIPSLKLGDNEEDILEGSKKSHEILSSAVDVLNSANDAGMVAERLGSVLRKLGPALGAIGIAFAIIDIFLPKQDSAELVYMKEQFGIVNSKLDAIKAQLSDVEDRLSFAIFKNKFLKDKATLEVCAFRLEGFQLNPTDNSKNAFVDQCCQSDTSPITFLYWMGSNVPTYADAAMKATGYSMGQFLTEMQGVVYSTTVAAYMESTCSGLIYTGNAINSQVQEVVDLSKKVISSVQQSITKLPSKYINSQLQQDVSKIVIDTADPAACAYQLSSVITDKLAHWKTKPIASAYCYSAISGWSNHAVSNYGPREHVGFFKEFRMHDKFSVGVDWTDSPMNIDYPYITGVLNKNFNQFDMLSTNGSSGIKKLRSVLNTAVSNKYNRGLRNVAYIKHGNSANVWHFSDREYWLDWQGYSIAFSVFPKTGKCIDKDQKCPYWARTTSWCSGSGVSWMTTNCKDSCQRDIQHCPYWKGKGYCTKTYVAYMTTNCKKSCDVC